MPNTAMTASERVSLALDFREPDRVPHFDLYWGAFAQRWRATAGVTHRPAEEDNDNVDDPAIRAYYDVDIYVAIADESPWFSRAGLVTQQGEQEIRRDGWGAAAAVATRRQVLRRIRDSLCRQVIAGPRAPFDPASSDGRYTGFMRKYRYQRRSAIPPFIFAKVGGPYLRSSFIGGEERWLMDMVEDPGLCTMLSPPG